MALVSSYAHLARLIEVFIFNLCFYWADERTTRQNLVLATQICFKFVTHDFH